MYPFWQFQWDFVSVLSYLTWCFFSSICRSTSWQSKGRRTRKLLTLSSCHSSRKYLRWKGTCALPSACLMVSTHTNWFSKCYNKDFPPSFAPSGLIYAEIECILVWSQCSFFSPQFAHLRFLSSVNCFVIIDHLFSSGWTQVLVIVCRLFPTGIMWHKSMWVEEYSWNSAIVEYRQISS